MNILEKIDKVLNEDIINLDTQVAKFLTGAQKIVDDYNTKNFPKQGTKLVIKKGPKYYKIIAKSIFDGKVNENSGFVWAFINVISGDIFKAASFNAPAKGARGNINDEFGGLKGVTPYGPKYLRGGNY